MVGEVLVGMGDGLLGGVAIGLGRAVLGIKGTGVGLNGVEAGLGVGLAQAAMRDRVMMGVVWRKRRRVMGVGFWKFWLDIQNFTLGLYLNYGISLY